MELSLRTLQEAVSIRRQIDTLERRLASLFATASSRVKSETHRRTMSAVTRAKLAAAARARWARLKAGKKMGRTTTVKKKGWNHPCWTEEAFPTDEGPLGGEKKSCRQKITYDPPSIRFYRLAVGLLTSVSYSSFLLSVVCCVIGSEEQLTTAHNILFWDQVV